MRILIFILILISCGEKESERGGQPGNEGPYTPSAPITFQADFYGFEGKAVSFDPQGFFTEDVSSGFTFSLVSGPDFLNIDTSTAELTGEPDAYGLYSNVTVKATRTADSVEFEASFDIAINGDPLRPYAWHLLNTGQSNFAFTTGTAGEDINAYNAYRDGATGDGVRVAISDSGVEINHDDLHENMLAGEHRDYSLNSPYIGDPTATTAHGTAVAGILAGRGWNNMGVFGTAPLASIAAFQFLDSTQSTELLISQASGDYDIFNYSYGDALYFDTRSDEDYLDHLRYQTLSNQKVYVKAAGNEFLAASGSTCAPHNANLPFENESPFIILVGATNADGGKASYSNAGSNLWVSAPGGEYGITYPAIMSTDLPTCFKGYSKADGTIYNDFEYGNSLNTQCHYTSTMNGTSSATPIVSGVIALMLEANGNLTQRDIKDILARTAKKVDPDFDQNFFGSSHPSNILSGCDVLNLSGHSYEQGWVQNGAGFWFNNFYGFGQVDAYAAVEAAKTYSSSLGSLQELNPDLNLSAYSNTPSATIPDSDPDATPNPAIAGLTDTISVSDNLTVESVQVYVNITHARPGQLGIELTGPSPHNTKSILLNINNSLLLGTDQNLNVVLTTHAFYGESSQGDWTLKIVDAQEGTTGTLNGWSINVLGH